jgi:hypothetical protein
VCSGGSRPERNIGGISVKYCRLSARKARQHVKILPYSTEKDPKDTSDRVFNKLAWGLFYGTEGVQFIHHHNINTTQ